MSEKFKTVLELYDLDDSSVENRTWLSQIENDGEKKYRARIYEIRILAPEKRKLWKKRRGQESRDKTAWYKEVWEIVGNGSPTGSVREETIAVSATIFINVERWHSRIRLRIVSWSRMREKHRETEVPEESTSGRMFRWPCKDYLKGTCINLFCEKWHPPECLFY